MQVPLMRWRWIARAVRLVRGGTKRLRIAEKAERNGSRLPDDRNVCITRSRFRSGRCEFSARCLIPWGTVLEGWHDLAFCGGVRSQLVGDDPLWRLRPAFQQTNKQAFGSLGIAAVLNDLVEHVAILIDGTPESVFLAGDGDDDTRYGNPALDRKIRQGTRNCRRLAVASSPKRTGQ
ncbi:hypothetical protein SAMN05428967_2386 [Phyllobacterium sp. YR620]|nr:hypothetical protein SAMN05428967_2386 [Phyllobacterium sp. YR620]